MATKLTSKEIIDLCVKTHGNLYDYSKLIYINARAKIEIICPKLNHGSFWQLPFDHYGSKKCGCPICGTERSVGSLKLDKEEILNQFREIHGDKYDYSEVNFIDTATKVKIICKVKDHPPFYQTPNTHKNKHGCKKCANAAMSSTMKEIRNKS